jgi:DNA-binding CsgD family transcriptional regulator
MFAIKKVGLLIQVYIVVSYLILFVLVGYIIVKKLWENYRYIRLVFLLLIGLVFNIVYGIMPDEHYNLKESSQNILVMTIFISSLLYILSYMKEENILNFFIKISRFEIAVYLVFILLFIIPYIQTESLEISLKIFFCVPSLLLLIQFFCSGRTRIRETLTVKNNYIKLHIIFGIISIVLLFILFAAFCFFRNKNIILTIFNGVIILFFLDFFLYEKRFTERERETDIEKVFFLFDTLTNREQEILNIIIESPEYTYSEISEKLFISEKTLSAHLSKIYKKLGAKGKLELIEKYSNKKEKS